MLSNDAKAGSKYLEKEETDLHLPIRNLEFRLAALQELQELLRQVIHAEAVVLQWFHSGATVVPQWRHSGATMGIQ
jgi:hypothetical protein